MYIKKLSIEGYRCFSELFEINFRKGLNVIVGENGAGKTTIINSFRQLFIDTESGSYNVSSDDFNKPFKEKSIVSDSFKIKVEFDGLVGPEPIAFLQWSDASNNVFLNLEVLNKELRGRFKKSFWGGNSKSSQFDIELFDKIHCIYLPPLRDAESKLVNGRQSRLSKLLKFIEAEKIKSCKKAKEQHPLEKKFKEFNQSLIDDKDSSIKKANELIADHLLKAVGQNFSQSTHIQFVENDFSKIVENLRLIFFPNITTGEADRFRDLCQNSLGYNNLLYIASILAELTLTADTDESLYRLLLIEEPEAHLHPQLQVRLLDHLEKVATHNNVQVIVTTHSTVLASSIKIDKIIHLTKHENPKATALAECGLAPKNLDFLNRWLDITKSNLLFASGVILVEGIAEQMLIPELAKTILKSRAINNIEDYGVSVINLNGIYFNHFMRLYCNIKGVSDIQPDQDGINIPIRCSGITDLDPDITLEEEEKSTDADGNEIIKKIKILNKPHENNILEGENHAIKLVESINSSEFSRLYVARFKTLEYDLAMEGCNAKEMAKILIELWPSKGSVIRALQEIVDFDFSKITTEIKADFAFEILKRVDDTKVGKGYFAQVLADRMSSGAIELVVPQYIENAILWACSLEKSSVEE